MLATTVTISDDHTLIRVGLAAALSKQPDFRVVGDADSVASTIALIREQKPDVAIVDLNMADGNGLSIVPVVREVSPNTRVLVLTMHVEPEIVRRALSAGIHGYVNKAAELDEVVRAVRAVAAGRSFLGVPVSPEGLQSLMQGGESSTEHVATPTPPPAPAANVTALSKRERQVLVLFARGDTHREIATELGVSTKTVETYRSRLGHKFGARTRAELARCAHALGLIEDGQGSAEDGR